ncbi:hypothetical protein L208DRAFT_1427978 [Tricholoma matsutake]|nr:hypothetical protein L208DRAFT_1427978 [Tricholoma matsutake 945]
MEGFPVKSEGAASIQQFNFNFHSPLSHTSSDSDLIFRFGSNSPFSLLMPWTNDDDDEVPPEKHVRRRSSKACDQCRKSKCKCERSAPGDPCKSCIMIGTTCTFLGPSRKRGPPKGYIDAIEARLHQTEALLGIIIAAKDTRAQSLLHDISKDSLAKEIINRVDNSPYGVKGRKPPDDPPNSAKSRTAAGSGSESSRSSQKQVDLTATHPSNEWQDRVSALLHDPDSGYGTADQLQIPQHQQRLRPQQSEPALKSSYLRPRSHAHAHAHTHPRTHPSHSNTLSHRPVLRVDLDSTLPLPQPISPSRRQRRRLDASPDTDDPRYLTHISRTHTRRLSLSSMETSSGEDKDGDEDGDGDGELTGAVGQLSLNEEEQVRYHGKASGLHLLGVKERVDGRNEGGIWFVFVFCPYVVNVIFVCVCMYRRFPKARVWPMVPGLNPKTGEDEQMTAQLPDPAVQEHLLDLYFTYVHPSFPVVHKRAFFEAIKNGIDIPHTPDDIPISTATATTSSPPFHQRRHRVPALLLLAMYALAARFTPSPPPPPPPSPPTPSPCTPTPTTPTPPMWPAGDDYLDKAHLLLDTSYATSRPATCQALLLLGYREIGIGAMAQAWTYVGMAIRMAQDLGMHRSADGWAREELGGMLFGVWELEERKRVWYACVIMDKYVSTYIGRPLMIFERDFDARLPSENDPEEMEDWPSACYHIDKLQTVPGRIISCFNASAVLSGILSKIVQAIYAVHTVPNRHTEGALLEGLLSKWYIELPPHLRFEQAGSAKRPVPPPHILTLHMQYWCAVLLLHRPLCVVPLANEDPNEGEARKSSKKSYELCAGAANHITSIASLYSDTYTLGRCSVFLCYYIFTASIMHVTSLTAHPKDPQARVGLSKCMESLRTMQVVWPSAARALELLRGAKFNLQEPELAALSNHPARHKRSADHLCDAGTLSGPTTRSTDGVDYGYFEAARGPGPGVGVGVGHPYNVQGVCPPSLPPPSHNPPHAHSHAHPHSHPDTHPHSHVQMSPASSISPHTPYFPSSYDRWTDPSGPTNSNSNSASASASASSPSSSSLFHGPLSTSVLPQIYSTGLVDDRVDRRVHTQAEQLRGGGGGGGNAHAHAARYQQYWHDYSTFPQLGTPYVGYQDQDAAAPVMASQQQQQQQQQQEQQQSHVYLSEPYNMYNNLAPMNR